MLQINTGPIADATAIQLGASKLRKKALVPLVSGFSPLTDYSPDSFDPVFLSGRAKILAFSLDWRVS